MNQRGLWIGLIVLAVLGGLLIFLRGGDERAIRSAWKDLVERVEKRGDENRVLVLARASHAVNSFAEPFRVDPSPHGPVITSRDTLRSRLHAVVEYARQISIDWEVLDLEVDRAGGSATLLLHIDAQVEANQRMNQAKGTSRIEWVKEDGDWLIREWVLLELETSPERPVR